MDQQPPQQPTPGTSPLGQYGPYILPPLPAPAKPRPAAPPPARMPKKQAITVTRALKKGLVASSLMSFGVLVALVAGHVTGATAHQASASSASGASASATNQTPANSDDGGGFFNQGPTNTGNSGFGISPSAPSQQPVSGSTVS